MNWVGDLVSDGYMRQEDPAWLGEIAGNDSYDDGDTYHDGNRNIDEPMGRASAVVVCDHSDDTARDIGSLGPASCLTEWFFEN
jgi:hypothetical protein